jgi:hypothetical protein
MRTSLVSELIELVLEPLVVSLVSTQQLDFFTSPQLELVTLTVSQLTFWVFCQGRLQEMLLLFPQHQLTLLQRVMQFMSTSNQLVLPQSLSSMTIIIAALFSIHKTLLLVMSTQHSTPLSFQPIHLSVATKLSTQQPHLLVD